MKKNPATSSSHFPTKLHQMLDEAEEKGHSHVISWCPDGKSFRIHNPQGMLPILSEYFRQTKYKSLLRQLQGYDFKRVTSGEDKGNVSHCLFLRGARHLCSQMKRKQPGTNPSTSNHSMNITNHHHSDENGVGSSASSSSSSSSNTSEHQPVRVASNGATTTTTQRPITGCSKSNLHRLESNFRNSITNNRVRSQAETNHHVSSVRSAPALAGGNAGGRQQFRATGMDALRVEIGCSFASPRNKSNSTNTKPMTSSSSSSCCFKRRQPQQPYHVQSSASAPEFERVRLSKRHRSFEGSQQQQQHHHLLHTPITSKNASFSFLAPQQQQEDAVLLEEKMQFQQSQLLEKQQKHKEFEQLEKLCFSNFPQGPGVQQPFQKSHRSTSALGRLDVDISLTTTTTTTHHNNNSGGDSRVSSSTICNSFVLPSLLEPTPILSPKNGPLPATATSSSTRMCDGFTLSCDIDFSSKPSGENNNNNSQTNTDIVVKLPSSGTTSSSLGRVSEESDEIDDGIVKDFGGNRPQDASKHKWTFDSDCQAEEEDDDWTKGITYHGKADCVLEPEEFRIEEQGRLSSWTTTQQHEGRLFLSQQKAQRAAAAAAAAAGAILQVQEFHCVPQRQPQNQAKVCYQQQQNLNHLLRPIQSVQQPLSGFHQSQNLPFRNPYATALLSNQMPFHRQNFPSQIQIQQIKR